jgi:hypothetical protein
LIKKFEHARIKKSLDTRNPMFVRFRYLQEQGIIKDRMALARAIDHYGFPKPIALGDNSLAWDLEKEVEPWLKSRPRRTPKSGASKRPAAVVEAV